MPRLLPTVATLVLGLVACSNAGEDLGLPPLGTGTLQVNAFLDRDGTSSLTAFDTILNGIRIGIFADGGIDTVLVAKTNANGLASFTSVPIGRYRYRLMPGALGDTLQPILGNDVPFHVRADSLNGGANLLVSFATLSLDAARQAVAGRPVFVHGVVTSALQFFADSAMFVTDGTTNLRITASHHRPGRNGNNVGDSVIVFGATGSDHGQPVLLNGVVLTVGVSAAPAITDLSVAEIASARGGTLDAALVRVSGATIADTVTTGRDFEVRITDGTDTARVVLDSLLQAPKLSFAPGRGITARGVLTPDGVGGWYLKPRPVNGEIVLN